MRSNKGNHFFLWIAKDSHHILRVITATAAEPCVVMETIYRPKVDPVFTVEDFNFNLPPNLVNLSESAMGFVGTGELVDFLLKQGGMVRRAAVTAEPAPPRPSPAIADLLGGVAMVEGENGVATGFLAKIHDVVCVVTNLHVIAANDKIVVKSVKGDAIPVQGVIGAVGSDIALLRVANPAAATTLLTLAKEVFKTVKIGDQVTVLGNRLGGGVATDLQGGVKGIGSNQIEVDAPFQPGNSGSPIVSLASGEVVGVAAYTEVVSLPSFSSKGSIAQNSGAVGREQRWFGFRLDDVAKWETIDLRRLRAQYQQVETFRNNSMALLAFFRNDIDTAKANPEMRSILERFESRLGLARNASDAAKLDEVKTLISYLKAFANAGVMELTGGQFYDYFRTNQYWDANVSDQLKFRADLLQALKENEAAVSAYADAVRNGSQLPTGTGGGGGRSNVRRGSGGGGS